MELILWIFMIGLGIWLFVTLLPFVLIGLGYGLIFVGIVCGIWFLYVIIWFLYKMVTPKKK